MVNRRSVLATDSKVQDLIKMFHSNSIFNVVVDKDAGTIIVAVGGETCFRGIQKGRNAPWIITYYRTSCTDWSFDG